MDGPRPRRVWEVWIEHNGLFKKQNQNKQAHKYRKQVYQAGRGKVAGVNLGGIKETCV